MANVQQLAEQFLRKFGPVTRASMARIAGDLDAGKVNLNGVSKEQALEVFKLVDAISFVADANRYNSAGDIQDPGVGKQIVEHQALKSPAIQQQIAAYAGDGEYAQAVQQKLNTEQGSPQGNRGLENGVDMKSDTGLQLPETDTYANGNGDDYTHTIAPTATGGGYSYTGNRLTSFYNKTDAKPTGNVSMRQDGRGGTYVSSLGNGDSRTQPTTKGSANSD